MKKITLTVLLALGLTLGPIAEANTPMPRDGKAFSKLSRQFGCAEYMKPAKGVHGWIRKQNGFTGTVYNHVDGAPKGVRSWYIAAHCNR